MTETAAPANLHLLDTSTDCVKVIGLDGRLMAMNPDGMCLMEIDDFETVRGWSWDALWPEAHRDTLRSAVALAAAGKVARFAADCPTAKGTPKHWDVVVSPVHDDAGKLFQLLAISRDVTREVLVAGERALVMSELAHRMQNLFAVVDGVIRISARSAPYAKEFADALSARFAGLGRSFRYIYRTQEGVDSGEAQRNVHGLLEELLAPYARDSAAAGKIAIEGDDHAISANGITPLALIVNELATNAVKYGALNQNEGSVLVRTKCNVETYELAWIESGAVGVAAPVKTGFGATLLDRIAKVQMRGAIDRIWKADGLEVRLTFPLIELGGVKA